MAAPTETYIDPAVGAAAGNDHGGAAFVDGSFANATNTLTKVAAFPAATCQAGDKLYLDDNGSAEVAAGLYTISVRTDNDNVVLTADIRSGGNDPTDVRCDQATGAVGLPWATVQHALDFVVRDAANGDRFNVKAGTDDVLAAALDFTTYGTPAAAAPWICQGYTTAAADGGIGGISGGGAVGIIAGDALDNLTFIEMHLHNCGAINVISIDNSNTFIKCEINNTSGVGLDIDNNCNVFSCYIHDADMHGVRCTGSTMILSSVFENGTKKFNRAIFLEGASCVAIGNIISIDSDSTGIYSQYQDSVIAGNSIYSSAGTGAGIESNTASNATMIHSNIVEGFSGIGGIGIKLAVSILAVYGHNAFYNNTVQLSDSTEMILYDLTANDINPLSSSAFIDAANDDFRIKPSVQALGYTINDYPGLAVRNYLDMGALQRMSQMLTHPGMSGGARG